MRRRIMQVVLAVFMILAGAWNVQARPACVIPRAMILYDGSKSMYPGFNVDKAVSAGKSPWFHERPDFVSWLLALAGRQAEAFGETEIALTAFYSVGKVATDTRLLHLRTFRGAGEIEGLMEHGGGAAVFAPLAHLQHANGEVGLRTRLTAALDKAAKDFDGVVWMVTDNFVEEDENPAVRDVGAFFRHIHDDVRYRAAHVFSYSYSYDDRKGSLAVYVFYVSPRAQDKNRLAAFDSAVCDLASLFPRKRHLKLKDLNVKPAASEVVEYSARITSDLSYFANSDPELRLDYKASVKSLLTQHTVIAGRCKVAGGVFNPEKDAVAAYGAEALPGGWLGEQHQDLPVIKPGMTQVVEGTLHKAGIALPGMSARAMRAWADSGEPLRYTGRVCVTLANLSVRVEARLLGDIYGMSFAPDVFGIKTETIRLDDQVDCGEKTISIFPPEPPKDGWVVPVLFLLVLLLAVALLWRRVWRATVYQVTTAGVSSFVSLRPLGGHDIMHATVCLGRLRRVGVGRDFRFVPNQQPGIHVERLPGEGGWKAAIGQARTVTVTIQSREGGKDLGRGGGGAGSPGAPSTPAAHGAGHGEARQRLLRIPRPKR